MATPSNQRWRCALLVIGRLKGLIGLRGIAAALSHDLRAKGAAARRRTGLPCDLSP